MKNILSACVALTMYVALFTACEYLPFDKEYTHTVVIDEAIESTCLNTGLTEGRHCSDAVKLSWRGVHLCGQGYTLE